MRKRLDSSSAIIVTKVCKTNDIDEQKQWLRLTVKTNRLGEAKTTDGAVRATANILHADAPSKAARVAAL